MAEFNIYKPDGTLLCVGVPVYNGTYMKPSSLTFRRIASPVPIKWEYGCYVEYRRLFDDATSFGQPVFYRLYSIPQAKKRSRILTCGNSFEYENVVFYDEGKLLEFCPFRDLVTADNHVHFSSRPTFSTYEAVDGIARRIEACLKEQYPDMDISVICATAAMGASQEVVDLMGEPREFSANLISCAGALDQIYQVWPGIGWVLHYRENDSAYQIVIGGGGIAKTGEPRYMYGKGRGLKELTRTLVNEGDLYNRIFPFGNTTNMPLRYYNGYSSIANNDSVDIPNLMPPIADWGKDEELKSVPAKAFYEDAASIARIGLRPRRVYFDGSDDMDNIYPTIKGMTVSDVRERALDYEDVDYPPLSAWTDYDPLDEIGVVYPDPQDMSVRIFDSGITGEDGKIAIAKAFFDHSIDTSTSVFITNPEVLITEDNLGPVPISGSSDLKRSVILDASKLVFSLSANREPSTAALSIMFFRRKWTGSAYITTHIYTKEIPLSIGYDGTKYNFALDTPLTTIGTPEFEMSDDNDYVMVRYYLSLSGLSGGSTSISYKMDGQSSLSFVRSLVKEFFVTIPPFGYDLKDIVGTDGSGVRIAMTSGKCAGREFLVKDTTLTGSGGWELLLERQYDDSLGQYFPNYDYPIASLDTFVILGIQMPDMYITAAAERLKTAALAQLDLYKKEVWQFNPVIDDKFMLNQGMVIIPGELMYILDADIVEGDTPEVSELGAYVYFNASDGYFYTVNGERILLDGAGYLATSVVDSVTIDEGAVIPAWKVTLRDRKKTKTGF